MALRGRPPKNREDWMVPVAELMVQECMSFSAACQALAIKWDNSAAERAAQYCAPFRDVMDALEFKYFARTGHNPLLTKEYLAGKLVWAIGRLAQQDVPDKIAMPGKLLADLMGWLEQKPDTPVIANLTQTEIDELRAKVEADKAAQSQIPVQVVVVNGEPN